MTKLYDFNVPGGGALMRNRVWINGVLPQLAAGAKRFSSRWQVLAGLTLGRNGVATGDLNDPNNARNFPRGIEGTDSEYAFRLSGSYTAPFDISVSGSFHPQRRIPLSVAACDHPHDSADTFVGYNNNVGGLYLRPTDILSPRVARMASTVDF